MDNFKIGQLIYRLRNEKHLTQLQSANQMNISDKTISNGNEEFPKLKIPY